MRCKHASHQSLSLKLWLPTTSIVLRFLQLCPKLSISHVFQFPETFTWNARIWCHLECTHHSQKSRNGMNSAMAIAARPHCCVFQSPRFESQHRYTPNVASTSQKFATKNVSRVSEFVSERISFGDSELWGGNCRNFFLETGDPSHSTRRRRSGDAGRAMAAVVKKSGTPGRFYFNVTGFPFPLGPFLRRRTIRKEVERGRIWTFEQEQALGFSSVATNTRMTVIKLKSGGLWVHAPIAPTVECIQLLKELEAPVEFIVLPTFAYEHKIFVGPFSRKFPKAQVWVAPRQWSWPINLPVQLFGIFKPKILRDDNYSAPWADEIDQKVLSCPVGVGPYVEVAFFHKKSKTLLVTDAVIYVPDKPPEVVGKELLLDAAKNGLAVRLLSAGREIPDDPIIDDEATRRRGWERMVLQILFLGPSDLLEPQQSFATMSKKLIVSPIVKTLVFCKEPERVKDWIDRIVEDWKFKSIIPCHFAAPIPAEGRDLRIAFEFLNELLPETVEKAPVFAFSLATMFSKASSFFPAADMKTLSSLDEFLVSVGAVRKTVSGKPRR